MDIERRVYGFEAVEVRAADGEKPAQIAGYAAVYGRESVDLGGFVEIIEPGFFSGVLAGDTRSLWNHNSDMPLGRTINGTLELRDDELGLHTVTTPPETSWGRDALISIGRGDVSQMSFAFTVGEGGERWYQREDGKVIRRLLAGGCRELYDISPVTYPAYEATRVSVRAKDKAIELGQADQGKQNADSSAEARAELERRQRKLNLESLR